MRSPEDNVNRSGPSQPGAQPLNGEIVPAPRHPADAGHPAASPVPAAVSRQFPSMGELLQGLRRCWLRAATFGVLLGAAAAAGAWFLMPMLAKTRAKTLLLVATEQPSVLFHRSETLLAFLSYKKTQIALVKSRIVLNKALRDPQVANLKMIRQHPLDPVEWLEGQLQVDYSTGPDILTISLSGDDGDELKQIVDAVTQAYLDEIVDKDRKRRNGQADELRNLKKKYEVLVESKRNMLEGVLNPANANDVDLERDRQKAAAQLAAFQTQLALVQSELLTMTAAATKEAEGIVPETTLEAAIDRDGQVQQIQGGITEVTSLLADLERKTTREAFPRLSATKRERLAELQKQLKERRDAVRPENEERLKGIMRAQQAQQQDRARALERLRKALDKNVDDLGLKVLRAQAPRRGAEMAAALRDDLNGMEDILKRVSDQVEIFNVEQDAETRITKLEPEPIVTHPDVYKRQLAGAAGGGLGGLVLVIFGLSYLECRSQRINSADEVVRGLGLKLMGTLPLLPARRRGGRADLDWESLLLESVDSIRTMLLHVARSERLRVVMVSSAVSGEGKTSLSSHLATSLARAGRRTLLIDCDLRRPSLARVFNLPGEEGFCELLRGEAGPDDVIQPTQVDGLWVLPAGACDPVALGALAHGGAAPILARLREQYEFVIVDSAPVLPVTDSLLVAQEVDGVLFSILRDVSRLGRVHSAYQRLAFLGVRILGAVVTGAPQDDLYDRDYRYVGHGAKGRSPALGLEAEADRSDETPAGEEA
jgi:capsular exopolysaccharide synthesis family protein